MINVFIADDHDLLREGFKKLLGRQTDMRVVGEAANGFDALEAISKTDIDIMILDISMPGKDGLQLIREIQQQKPELKTLVYSMHAEERYAVRCFKAGACGYMNKSSDSDKIIEAIYKIYNGGKYLTPELAERILEEFNDKSSTGEYENLSNREYDIFIKLAEGKSTSKIAEILFLSKSTVHTYRARIFKKMGFSNVAQVTQYAIEKNLID